MLSSKDQIVLMHCITEIIQRTTLQPLDHTHHQPWNVARKETPQPARQSVALISLPTPGLPRPVLSSRVVSHVNPATPESGYEAGYGLYVRPYGGQCCRVVASPRTRSLNR